MSEPVIHRKVKHGHCTREGRSPTYTVWRGMTHRCRHYPMYMEVGIDRSWNLYENFLSDMGERPSKNHQIDRIDNYKGYSKDNCRWATRQLQGVNQKDKKRHSGLPRGICRARGKFKASFSGTYLGVYDDQELAQLVYSEARDRFERLGTFYCFKKTR